MRIVSSRPSGRFSGCCSLTSLSSSHYLSFSEKTSTLNSWFQTGEIYSRLYPDIAGNDRVREQLASLPSRTETDRDRPSQLHVRSHLFRRRGALADHEDAQRYS